MKEKMEERFQVVKKRVADQKNQKLDEEIT